MDSALGRAISIDDSKFRTILEKFPTYVFDIRASDPGEGAREWQYVVRGWAPEMHPTKYMSSRTVCLECGSPLKPHGGVNAAIYGSSVEISARHCRARCSKNACRARHWFNYRVRNGEEKYFSEKYREDVLFVTAGVAFDCAFIRYVQ